MNNSRQPNTSLFKKFAQNRAGLLSVVYIVVMVLIAVFAYLIIPNKTKDANQGELSIKSKPPGFEVLMLEIPLENQKNTNVKDYFLGKEVQSVQYPVLKYEINNDTLIYIPYTDSALEVVYKLPMTDFDGKNPIQKKKFWLGTDKQGRDYLSRILLGTRVSLSVGIVSVSIALLIGVFLGGVSGYFGGKVDQGIMWFVSVFWSIPTILMVVAITLALGKGFWQVFLAIGLTMWVEIARIVRGQVLSVKQSQYVIAAQALGYSHWRILRKHILPSVIPSIVVVSAANFASAILMESGLSFLGLGVQPPTSSWGMMIKDSYSEILLGKPYLAIIPGVAISTLTLSFMLVGNAIRDVLDVKN
ncbi:MAG: ABC transporter permease [Bacteroidota bacterium]|nr:ABC transporter permease [Bacteroidota bacterium]